MKFCGKTDVGMHRHVNQDSYRALRVWNDEATLLVVCDGMGGHKAYKQNPEAFKGSVADTSMFIRVAVTGKQNAPDLYTVMQIIGKDKTKERICKMVSALKA